MMDITTIVRFFSLKNRLQYGKADVKSVIGKVILFLEKKEKIRELLPTIERIVKEVNEMSEEEAKSLLSQLPQLEISKKESNPFLLEKPVVMRFAPEPSGFLHLGHAKALFLNVFYVERNDGKLLLRFDDTNPELARQEYVDSIMEDLEWLGIKFDKVSFSSDYMELFYQKIKELIEKGKAYVCFCEKEEIAKQRKQGVPCIHRNAGVEENLSHLEELMSGKKGIIRYKGEMKATNTVMRDPTLFRVIDEPHYRLGERYKLYPTYDFAVAVLDSVEGITYALRSKEYELREELYHSLQRDLGLREVNLIHIARLVIRDNITSKRKIRELVKEGKLEGWDDPRLVTIKALRRRGILPQAIRTLISQLGREKSESIVSISQLFSINRSLLDKKAGRSHLICDPVEVEIEYRGEVRLKRHPEIAMGERRLIVNGKILVERENIDSIVSLKGLGNYKIEHGRAIPTEEKGKTVVWLGKNVCKVKILNYQPILTEEKVGEKIEKECLAEDWVENLKDGEYVHFVGKGFFVRRGEYFIHSC